MRSNVAEFCIRASGVSTPSALFLCCVGVLRSCSRRKYGRHWARGLDVRRLYTPWASTRCRATRSSICRSQLLTAWPCERCHQSLALDCVPSPHTDKRDDPLGWAATDSSLHSSRARTCIQRQRVLVTPSTPQIGRHAFHRLRTKMGFLHCAQTRGVGSTKPTPSA